MNASTTVARLAAHLLRGAVLQARAPLGQTPREGVVSVGNGTLIDWRFTPSGDTVLEGADAFDLAYLFVRLVPAPAVEELLRSLEPKDASYEDDLSRLFEGTS